MKLLERNIEAADRRLVLLAPAGAVVPDFFRNRETDADRHRTFVLQMQQLRGSIYLRDGAVERRRLAPDGTHRTPEDAKSWHLLMLNTDRRVSACAWYLPHEASVSMESLRVRNCPLAHTEGVRDNLRNAVESEIASARRDGIGYAEVGGWAVEKERTAEGLVLALAGYSLARVHGGTLGITTATVRHCSSTILRRLGGSSLQAADGVDIPTYYDPTYRCAMELLRFDSRRPNPHYAPLIERLQHKLAEVLVIATPASASSPALEGASRRSSSSSLPPLAA
jgi:hypothetical protein